MKIIWCIIIHLLILIILAGDIEMNPGPRSQCRLCKKYCKASEKSVKCEECEKRFHTSCISLDEKELLELLAFLDFHQSQIVAIQETKIDSSILTSELFPESCPYNVYRKDRTLDGGGVMLLIHKDISHMPITELENDSESIWVKVFANKTSHFVASWYRPPGGDLEKLDSQLKSLKSQLEKVKDIHKGNKPPSVHILGDFNFCDIVWPDRLSKSGSPLSSSEGEKFIEILNDHHLEQLVHFPTREKK